MKLVIKIIYSSRFFQTLGGKHLRMCIVKSPGRSATYLPLSKRRMYAVQLFSFSGLLNGHQDGTEVGRLGDEISIRKDLLDFIKS